MIHDENSGYYKNKHSCFLLQYHLVLVTKYRKKIIIGEIEKFLKEYTANYFNIQGFPILAMECMPDHIHILFEADPQTSMAKFVNAFKSASSRKVRETFKKDIAKVYWKPYFWSLSYFLGTVSERTTEVVKNYIDHQKEE